jgi:GNAT superfamily N-acetyltransferase
MGAAVNERLRSGQMRSGVRLRRADLIDLPAVQGLLEELGYPHLHHEALAARQVLVRLDLDLFLAVDRADTPLGLIQLSHRPQLHLGGTLVSIDALVVTPAARGRGIGARLLHRARAYARLHRAVRLEVHTSRARANYRRDFYPAHGYREVDSALFRLAALEEQFRRGPRLPPSGEVTEGQAP